MTKGYRQHVNMIKLVQLVFVSQLYFHTCVHSVLIHQKTAAAGKGLHSSLDPGSGSYQYHGDGELVTLDAAEDTSLSSRIDRELVRIRRDAGPPGPGRPKHKLFPLLDKDHNEAIIHWSGKKSPVVFILTRQHDRRLDIVNSSRLYRSDNYGNDYKEVISSTLKNAVIDQFYVCPTNSSKLLFTDRKNKVIYATTDEGVTYDRRPVKQSESLDRLTFHPTRQDWALLYDDTKDELLVTEDFAASWKLVQQYVNPRVYWGDPREDDTLIHMEVQDPLNQGVYRFKTCGRPYCTDQTHDKAIAGIDVSSLLKLDDYMFTQKTTADKTSLYVSYLVKNDTDTTGKTWKRTPFQLAYFPHGVQVKDCVVLDSDQQEVFLAVKHIDTQQVNLYISDVTGRFFVPSLTNVRHIPYSSGFFIDFKEVRGIPGRYIANQVTEKGWKTLMTYDQGRTWGPLSAKTQDYSGKNIGCTEEPGKGMCNLNLILTFSRFFMSEENATGIIIAQGMTDEVILDPSRGPLKSALFYSTDGGISWIKFRDGVYLSVILDQGGAIMLVPRTTTKEFYYSFDEGQNWGNYTFIDKEVQVDGAVTEPGIKTLYVTLFAHKTKTEEKGWWLASINFTNVLTKECTAKEYSTWTLQRKDGQGRLKTCVLGQQHSYKRRNSNAQCINGLNYFKVKAADPCDCTQDDYECDFGYTKQGTSCIKEKWFDDSKPLGSCPEGSNYFKSSGYRKVSADKCTKPATSPVPPPKSTPCPTMPAGGLVLESDSQANVAAVGKEVKFTLLQTEGSKKSTNYTWSFGDGTKNAPQTGYVKGQAASHKFTQAGSYTVTVEMSNKAGKSKAQLNMRIQETIQGIHVHKKHGALAKAHVRFSIHLNSGKSSSVHYEWTFGDEQDKEKPLLTWSQQVSHIYPKAGDYQVTVEAINSISSAFKIMNIHVYDNLKVVTVQFDARADKLNTQGDEEWMEEFGDTIQKQLSERLNIDRDRLEVDILRQKPLAADVTVFPSSKVDENVESIDLVIRQLKSMVANHSLEFTIDQRSQSWPHDRIRVSIIAVNDVQVEIVNNGHNTTIAVAVSVPVLFVAIMITALICVYYKKKLLRPRQYRMLPREDEGDDLLGGVDDDDDDPMLDPNPDNPTTRRQRALHEEEDLQPFGTRSSLVMMGESGPDDGDLGTVRA